MSQHFYSANYQGKQIMVLCGWDRPIQQELVYFQQKLDAFGIKLPKSMMDQVREDRLNNVGNRDKAVFVSCEITAL